ncbi:MAG: hypothetical protein ACM3SU_02175 [Acidobacteriota bacterium]
MAASWQRWINPFLDASREMNVPARVAAGERLYRDVVYHYGPAGPWLEGAAVALFGRRLAVLEGAGLIAAVLLFSSLWRLTARAGSPLSACLATTWAAAICLGAPNGGSFLFPYSFDALFALSGAFLSVSLAAEPAGRARDALCAAGVALALAAKPEIGAAAAVVLLVAGLRAQDRKRETGRALRVVGLGALAALLAWGIALSGVPWAELSPEGPLALFSPPAPWRAVYRVISGLADPGRSLASVATALFLDALILAAAALLSRAAGRAPLAPVAVWGAGAAAAVWFLLAGGAGIEDRIAPLLAPMPVAAALAALAVARRPLDPDGRARFLLYGLSAAVGLRVVLGLAYGARTTPYSILAVPGLAASAAVLVVDRLPRRLAAPETFRRLLALAFLALAILAVGRWRRLLAPQRAARLETPAGTLRLPPERSRVTEQALAFLAHNARPGDGLSGAPEAGFFNFVTGLRSPLRQEQIFPGHLDAAAEARAAERLETAGPRFFLLVNQPAPAFESAAFGRGYAVRFWSVVERRYRLVAWFGQAPPEAPVGWPHFFIRVYERRPGS